MLISSDLEKHRKKVKEISKLVSQAFKEQRKLRIFHGFSHTTREFDREKNAYIDISGLNNILEVNTEANYALVEPNVTMDVLVFKTMEKGLVPLVVPELPKITAGGAIQGGAGESSSFKYGGVHNICEEYEVVLGNGEIVTASSTTNSGLFWGLPCSYGSLGITTLAKIRLTQAKKFVNLKYLPVSSFSELLEVIENQVGKNIDFIDAILFNAHSGIVMTGFLIDDPGNGRVASFSKKHDEWFYIHVLNKIREVNLEDDFIPLADYLFRYNQGAFWTGKILFDRLKIPFTKLTRSFFYKYLSAENLGKAVQSVNNSQSGICQDFCLPDRKLVEFLDYLEQTLKIYPLWICPLQSSQGEDKLSPVYMPAKKVINVGMYALFNKSYDEFVKTNKDLERKLDQLEGRKVLYAHQYYSPEEFWQIYDFNWYHELRQKYFASNVFMDIYSRTHVNKKYKTKQFRAILGLLKHLGSNKK